VKIVNKHGAPKALIRFANKKNYDKGRSEFSATGLLEEPRIVAMEKLHGHVMEDDPYENPWKYLSTVFHAMMAENVSDREGEVAEERIFTDFCGTTISGAMDLQILSVDVEDFSKHVTVGDYKFTTVFATKDTAKWEQQLNIYAWLVEREKPGMIVDKLEIYAFLRDWRISSAERIKDYPPTTGMTIELPLWPFREREEFVAERIRLHREAQENLPDCSHEGRWPTGKIWWVESMTAFDPVKKKFNLKREADEFVKTMDRVDQMDSVVHSTFKTYRRCLSYCHFSEVCSQWAEWKDKQEGEHGD